jgi:hypothetical protein
VQHSSYGGGHRFSKWKSQPTRPSPAARRLLAHAPTGRLLGAIRAAGGELPLTVANRAAMRRAGIDRDDLDAAVAKLAGQGRIEVIERAGVIVILATPPASPPRTAEPAAHPANGSGDEPAAGEWGLP